MIGGYVPAVVNAVRRQRVIAIVRTDDAAAAATTARALLDAGLLAVEISLTVPGAQEVIASLTNVAGDAFIGAGTVLDGVSARMAIAAGARFLVSPVTNPEVIATAHLHGCAAVPGAGTATEALAALTAGADLVKLFPASLWTAAAVRDLLQALPQLPLVPTAGVSVDSAADWIRAGAAAVGMGGALSRGDAAAIRGRAETLLASLGSVARA